MFHKKTSRRTRKSRDRMLELRVSSPRILWFNFLRAGGGLLKFAAVMLLLVGLFFGLRAGYKKLFIENEEFVLKEVPLLQMGSEEDPMFMTHGRVVDTTSLDLSASIFALDVDDIEKALQELPEIIEAKVTRRLPGTLKIEVEERVPVAWLECPGLELEGRNFRGGRLIDKNGVLFPCATTALWEYSESLPILFIQEMDEPAAALGATLSHEGLLAGLELIQASPNHLSGDDLPQWVVIRDEITLELMTFAETRATFSYFGQSRQMEDFSQLLKHASESGRSLATVNLNP